MDRDVVQEICSKFGRCRGLGSSDSVSLVGEQRRSWPMYRVATCGDWGAWFGHGWRGKGGRKTVATRVDKGGSGQAPASGARIQ